jgi:hypothetical protein
MRALATILLLITLAGCASPREQPSKSDRSWDRAAWAESIRETQRQREAADAQAKATGDNRPYPTGWPNGLLPRNPDPIIVESIHPGQTMEDVIRIMGAEGWSLKDARDKFLSSSRSSYNLRRSSRKEPGDWKDLKRSIPVQGQFTEWRYQGFPTTADWIVVFFASPQSQQNAEPRVVARGVFGLGCLF